MHNMKYMYYHIHAGTTYMYQDKSFIYHSNSFIVK